ncbi:MAG TPA: response regulator [Planctomycetota bacterium]|nr:response regulator [Planctomycetota bacterium]
MGRISGDLGVLGIANLFQALSANSRGGLLTVSRGDERKTVGCGPEGLRLLRGIRRVSPLGEILLRTRKINREQLKSFLADNKGSGVPFGEYLTKRGLLSQETIDQALREQVADEIYDLFTWTEGTFEFKEAEGGEDERGEGILSTVLLDQSVMFIALEAARRMDELARIRDVIPEERLVPVALEVPMAGSEPGLDRDTISEILPYVDGRRSVAQIIEASLYSRFTVLLALYALAQRGSAKIRDVGAADGPETVLMRRPARAAFGRRREAPLVLMSDQARERIALALYLGHLGFHVIECPTKENLPNLLSHTSVGAVILDTEIGTDPGFELCRSVVEKAGVPVMLLTPLDGMRSVDRAYQSGAVHVLLKPVHSELAVERLDAMLTRGAPAAGRTGARD